MADNSFKFGLRDCKIASWTNASAWGTAIDVDATRQMTVNAQTVSGLLEGDDVIKDAHAKIISAQITFQFGFKDLAAWAIMTGQTHESNGSNDAMTFADSNMPYFGIIGRIDDTDATGNDVIFVPKCKLMDGFELRMEYGQYMTPQLTLTAVYNDATYGFFRVLQYAANTAVAIPPTAI